MVFDIVVTAACMPGLSTELICPCCALLADRPMRPGLCRDVSRWMPSLALGSSRSRESVDLVIPAVSPHCCGELLCDGEQCG